MKTAVEFLKAASYEREFLQCKGIPHLPGDWEFRSEDEQADWISKNYPDILKDIKEGI